MHTVRRSSLSVLGAPYGALVAAGLCPSYLPCLLLLADLRCFLQPLHNNNSGYRSLISSVCTHIHKHHHALGSTPSGYKQVQRLTVPSYTVLGFRERRHRA